MIILFPLLKNFFYSKTNELAITRKRFTFKTIRPVIGKIFVNSIFIGKVHEMQVEKI